MSKRCFVISPIGQPDSPEREHADDVLEFIIEPAMQELGMQAYRADHTHQMGRITDQMFSSILNEDLCIAILTGHNPNVFYELAIAQSAARPVIILIEKGESIPFDIRDLRAIVYDLKPRPLRDGVYAKQIIEHVRHLSALNWTVPVPFGNHLSPLGNLRQSYRIHDYLENFGPSEKWIELVRSATHELDLSGITLRWWTKSNSTRNAFLQKAEEGCKIRFLQLDPSNPGIENYLNESISIDGIDRVYREIEATYDLIRKWSQSSPNIEVRRVKRGGMHTSIMRIDQRMLVTLMLYSESTHRSPMIECGVGSCFYKSMRDEFDMLWNINSPVIHPVPPS